MKRSPYFLEGCWIYPLLAIIIAVLPVLEMNAYPTRAHAGEYDQLAASGAPPVLFPETQVESVTSTSAVLVGRLNSLGSSSQAHAFFDYGLTGAYGMKTTMILMTSPRQFSVRITGLMPGRMYHARAHVISPAGESVGYDTVFMTKALTVPIPSPTFSPTPSPSPIPTPAPTPTPAITPTPTPTPSPTPTLKPAQKASTYQAASVLVSPDQDTEIVSASGNISVRVPPGAVSRPVNIALTELVPWGSTGRKIVKQFELNAWDAATGENVTQFNKDLEIVIRHDPDDLRGLDTQSLRLFSLNESTRNWVGVPSHYDSQTRALTATTNHFTNYGEQADPLLNGPGRVMAAQTDLHAGTVRFSYPLELPPGPGGFQPRLELTYDSGVVDETKNKRATASWVGSGWSLGLGSISHDLASGRRFLQLNQGSYEIYTSDGTNYHTNPEQHFKFVTDPENPPGWEMWDKDGNYYQFGKTQDSQQYITGQYDPYYRLDLNLIRDTNGNETTVSYTRDIMQSPNRVRSAYPEYLRYGNVEVHFHSSYDEYQDGGYVRKDNPIKVDDTETPMIMETRKLDYVEIKVNGDLLRKYTFGYDTTYRTWSSDYGGIYYSGKHSLVSITQNGTDDQTLPPMTFDYQDLEVYRHACTNATGETDYYGNPGNPASLTRAHLARVNSGYGGSVAFSYVQTPDNSSYDRWTRQVVTGKVTYSDNVSNVVADNVTYTYTTADGIYPKYLGGGWDQKYRGFNEIKETDAAGNYVKHWFYATGVVDGKDGEKLSGREYKTQWFSSSGSLLREKTYDWTVHPTSEFQDFAIFWSSDGRGDGLFSVPYGIAATSDNFVYVADGEGASACNHRFHKFDLHGDFVFKRGTLGSGNYNFNNPKGIAASAYGYVYVVDSGNYAVKKYNSEGTYQTGWGGYGTYDWQFMGPCGIAVSSDNYVYVSDTVNNRIQKFNTSGTFIRKWSVSHPYGVAVSSAGYVYVANGNTVYKYNGDGSLITSWGSYSGATGIAVAPDGYVYVSDYWDHAIRKYDAGGSYVRQWDSSSYYSFNGLNGIAVSSGSIYVTEDGTDRVQELTHNWSVRLSQIDETMTSENKTSRTRYAYDDYDNIITEYRDGDVSTNGDDATTWYAYSANTTANILSKIGRERVYSGIVTDNTSTTNLKKETRYYYDGSNSSWPSTPSKGNLTRLERKTDNTTSVSTNFTYDSRGNKLTDQDPGGNTTTWTYDSDNVSPKSKTYAISGLSENYTYDPGTRNLLSLIDVNGQTTSYEYDTFKRLTKVIKPGDNSTSPGIEYQYNNWGTLNQQHIKVVTKTSVSDNLTRSDYFDGLGRVVQVHAKGETGHTIVSSTTTYNNRGLVDKQYVSQDIASLLTSYQTPEAGWKYTSYAYDGLGRVTTRTNPDSTNVTTDYSTAWQSLVTGERGYKKRYYFDAFQRLAKVQELDASHQLYATTEYTYDVLGNLTQVKDSDNNTTTMTYDWLSRKTAMTDPDMGSWGYGYDSNGNLTTQTDNKSQTIAFAYDALNRLTGKTYPGGSGMTNVTYAYDNVSGGNSGKGRRTAMTDALGTANYTYDARGRLIEEKRSGVSDSWLSGWNNRAKITIDHTRITDNLTHFPVLLHLSSSCGEGSDNLSAVFSEVSGNYLKIAATKDDAVTQLYVEVEKWDNVTGEAWLWVSRSGWQISSSADTVMYLYYDGTHADNTDYVGTPASTPGKAVWDSSFRLVDHMGDGTDNATIRDSTSYGNNVAKKGAAEPTEAAGKLYKGQDFDGNDDYATIPDNADFDFGTGDFTFSFLMKAHNWSNYQPVVSNCVFSGDWDGLMIGQESQGGWVEDSVRVDAGSAQVRGNTALSNNTWYHVAVTRASGTIRTYLNGVEDGSGYAPANITVDRSYLIGRNPDTTYPRNFDGLVDELRVSKSTARSAAWLAASYYAASDNLISFGDAEAFSAYSTFTTQFGYDSADRNAWTLYPTGENVTQAYNGRGLPYSLSGTTAGNLVTSALYNSLGQATEINLGNGAKTTHGYWGTGGAYDTSGGYYGRLWELKTAKSGQTLMDMTHAWDAGGNLTSRFDVLSSDNETFGYDFLDRLTSVSGNYSASYAYNQIGNITTMNGSSYTYSTKPHAVTAVGGTSYTYDSNGNMLTRGTDNITWDAENRPVSISYAGGTENYTYDGDGRRVKKVSSSQTTIYISKFYEKNLSTAENTTYYYLGNKLVALSNNSGLRYIYQDHLTGTAVTDNGTVETIRYYPYGSTRSGSVPTDKKFTGQRLDGTGLYYYGARYYDPGIGRFISPDAVVYTAALPAGKAVNALVVSYSGNRLPPGDGNSETNPSFFDPQFLNRYSYTANNPLGYVDDSGNAAWAIGAIIGAVGGFGVYAFTHQGSFDLREAAQWTAGGALIGMTLGAATAAVTAGLAAGTAEGAAATTAAAVAGQQSAQRGLGAFSRAAEYGIRSYNELTKITTGTGLRIHHLIEQRFAARLGLKPGKIPSIALTPEEHQELTNAWHDAISYMNSRNGLRTDTATIEDIWAAAQNVYSKYPELLKAVEQFLFDD